MQTICWNMKRLITIDFCGKKKKKKKERERKKGKCKQCFLLPNRQNLSYLLNDPYMLPKKSPSTFHTKPNLAKPLMTKTFQYL